jgi:hypothetical protein
MLLHRADLVAELLPVDDATGRRYGVELCATHLGRAKAPVGWEIINRLQATPPPPRAVPARPRVHGAPGSTTNPARPVWLPGRGSADEDVSELRDATSPLLRRAFQATAADDDEVDGQLSLLV